METDASPIVQMSVQTEKKYNRRFSDLLLITAFVIVVFTILSIISYWLSKPSRPSWVGTLESEIDKKTEAYWLGDLATIQTDYTGSSYRVTVFDSQMKMLYDNAILALPASLPTGVMPLTELVESTALHYGFVSRNASASNVDSTGTLLLNNYYYYARQYKDSEGYTRFVRFGQTF
jgi:hypothetical protein